MRNRKIIYLVYVDNDIEHIPMSDLNFETERALMRMSRDFSESDRSYFFGDEVFFKLDTVDELTRKISKFYKYPRGKPKHDGNEKLVKASLDSHYVDPEDRPFPQGYFITVISTPKWSRFSDISTRIDESRSFLKKHKVRVIRIVCSPTAYLQLFYRYILLGFHYFDDELNDERESNTDILLRAKGRGKEDSN